MRKILAVLLMLLLLIPHAALAESAGAYEENSYTHPTLGYSLTPAENWLLLDESIVNDLLNDLAEGKSEFSHEALSQFYALLNGTLLLVAYSPDGQLNLNIGPEYFGIDADIQTLAPSLRETAAATLSYASLEDEGSIITFGQTDYLRICAGYEMSGMSMRACQYIAVRDGMGYYLTFSSTGAPSPLTMEEIEAAALPFLESFRLPEVSAYTVGTVQYTHPDHGYSLSIPETWMTFDRRNMDSLPEQMASQISSYNGMITAENGGAKNINIITFEADENAALLSLAPSLMLAVQRDYAAYEDVEFLDTGSIVKFGSADYLRFSARMTVNGMLQHFNQYCICGGSVLYMITLTCPTSSFTVEIMDAVARPFLESFTLPD